MQPTLVNLPNNTTALDINNRRITKLDDFHYIVDCLTCQTSVIYTLERIIHDFAIYDYIELL